RKSIAYLSRSDLVRFAGGSRQKIFRKLRNPWPTGAFGWWFGLCAGVGLMGRTKPGGNRHGLHCLSRAGRRVALPVKPDVMSCSPLRSIFLHAASSWLVIRPAADRGLLLA